MTAARRANLIPQISPGNQVGLAPIAANQEGGRNLAKSKTISAKTKMVKK
jgi:hypothetical protein